MKFRLHKGSLIASMATVVDIEATKQAIVDHYNSLQMLGAAPCTPQDIEVKPYGYDHRNCWDTHIVVCSEGVIGFTNGPVVRDEPDKQAQEERLRGVSATFLVYDEPEETAQKFTSAVANRSFDNLVANNSFEYLKTEK